jgi:hypothetical protein
MLQYFLALLLLLLLLLLVPLSRSSSSSSALEFSSALEDQSKIERKGTIVSYGAKRRTGGRCKRKTQMQEEKNRGDGTRHTRATQCVVLGGREIGRVERPLRL